MSKYEYKVVPFVGQMKSGGAIAIVSEQLQSAINQHAQGGWEYYRMETVDIEVQPGCLAALGGAKAGFIQYNQLIFRAPAGTPLPSP